MSGCSGCGTALDSANSPISLLSFNDVIGTYRPTKETMADILSRCKCKRHEISISLKEDKTFVMKNLSDWWRTCGNSVGGFDSTSGNWNIEHEGSSTKICFKFDKLVGKDGGSHETDSLFVMGNEPPYSLWLYVGDPDEGHVMIFERERQ